MPELTTTISVSIAGLGVLFLLVAFWPLVRRKPKRYCPGPLPRWLGWLNPFKYFTTGACRYDLSHTEPTVGGGMRCSECGAQLGSRFRLLRSERRLRFGRIGVVIVSVAGVLHWQTNWQWRDAVKLLPSTPLLIAEAQLNASTPWEVFDELRDRAEAGQLNDREMNRLIALLVRDLRDDDRQWNADRAFDLLRELAWKGNVNAENALYEALNSDDWQQRQLALHMLQRLPWVKLTEDVKRVTLESLRDDHYPYNGGFMISNADDSTSFLMRQGEAVSTWLDEGMASSEMQERLCCARVVASGKIDALMPIAVSILVEHLADNNIRNDAGDAWRALEAYGVGIVDWLQPYRDAPDKQQRESVRKIIENVTWRDYLQKKREQAVSE